jgi:hypothetical protein
MMVIANRAAAWSMPDMRRAFAGLLRKDSTGYKAGLSFAIA